MLEQNRQLRASLKGWSPLSLYLRKSPGKGCRLIGRKPFPRQQATVATEEFPVGRCARPNGKVPGPPEEFNRIAALPGQSQAHIRRDDGGKEGSTKHSIQGVIGVLVVGGRDELEMGQALVRVTDGELFLRRTSVPGQGKGEHK
jgi:hypothetical protein